MSTRTNNYSRKHYDGWGSMPIGLGVSETKKVTKDYHTNFVNSLYDNFVLPLIIIKNSSNNICVTITQNTVIDLPFIKFAEEVAKKYGKPETLYLKVNMNNITKEIVQTVKLWTLYGTMFCRYCFVNDLSLQCCNRPVAYIGKPIYAPKLTGKTKKISLEHLNLRDEMLKINWDIHNEKEIKLYEYFASHNKQYYINKNLYNRYMNFINEYYFLDESATVISNVYKTPVEKLEPKHSVINKLYNMSLDSSALPETYYKHNSVWVNHPYDNTQNKKIEYTQKSLIGGDFKYKSFIARNNLFPTYTIEKLSNDWILTSDNEIKKVLSDTSDYTICEVSEEQTWVSYNLKEPHKKTVHQELVTYKTIETVASIEKENSGFEIEYTSFEDTYADDYENSMCPYEDSINKLYAEAEAEEETEYANLWEEE